MHEFDALLRQIAGPARIADQCAHIMATQLQERVYDRTALLSSSAADNDQRFIQFFHHALHLQSFEHPQKIGTNLPSGYAVGGRDLTADYRMAVATGTPKICKIWGQRPPANCWRNVMRFETAIEVRCECAGLCA